MVQVDTEEVMESVESMRQEYQWKPVMMGNDESSHPMAQQADLMEKGELLI